MREVISARCSLFFPLCVHQAEIIKLAGLGAERMIQSPGGIVPHRLTAQKAAVPCGTGETERRQTVQPLVKNLLADLLTGGGGKCRFRTESSMVY